VKGAGGQAVLRHCVEERRGCFGPADTWHSGAPAHWLPCTKSTSCSSCAAETGGAGGARPTGAPRGAGAAGAGRCVRRRPPGDSEPSERMRSCARGASAVSAPCVQTFEGGWQAGAQRAHLELLDSYTDRPGHLAHVLSAKSHAQDASVVMARRARTW